MTIWDDPPTTQTDLNDRCNRRIREMLDESLPITSDPYDEKLSRYMSFIYLRSLFFACKRCGELTENAFAYCGPCAESMRGSNLTSLMNELYGDQQ